MRRFPSLLIAASALLVLSACATTPNAPASPSASVSPSASASPTETPTTTPSPSATPAVDLDAARAWLKRVKDAESDGPGAAGIVSMLVGPDDDDADGAGDDEDDVRIDFRNAASLTRADARCFGGAAVELEVEVTAIAKNGEDESFDATIPCDEEPHAIDLAGTKAVSVVVEAESDVPTYVHVTVIEALVVER